MQIHITATLLDQIGLVLGLISGLLVFPGAVDFLQLEKVEREISVQLTQVENWAGFFPHRFNPPSWKAMYTPEERDEIEPITAFRTLVFCLVWISLVLLGAKLASLEILALGLCLPLLVVVLMFIVRRPLVRRLPPYQRPLLFIGMFLLLVFVTPTITLIRICLLLLRKMLSTTRSVFEGRQVLRSALTFTALVAFLLSNIFQFIATLL